MHFQWIEIFIEMQSIQWIWFVKAILCSEYKFLNNWTNGPIQNRKVTHTLPLVPFTKKKNLQFNFHPYNNVFGCEVDTPVWMYKNCFGILKLFKTRHITTCGVLLETLLSQPLPYVICGPKVIYFVCECCTST